MKHLSWDEGWRILEQEAEDEPLDTAVLRHLDQCVKCSRLLAQVRQTVSSLQSELELPKEVVDRADDDALWRGIEERIAGRVVDEADQGRLLRPMIGQRGVQSHRNQPVYRLAGWLGAAAILLIVAGGVGPVGATFSPLSQVNAVNKMLATGHTTQSTHQAGVAQLPRANAALQSTSSTAMSSTISPSHAKSSPLWVEVFSERTSQSMSRPLQGAHVDVLSGQGVLWSGVTGRGGVVSDVNGTKDVAAWSGSATSTNTLSSASSNKSPQSILLVVWKQGYQPAIQQLGIGADGQRLANRPQRVYLSLAQK